MGRAVTSVSELCEAIATLTGDARAWAAASQRSREYMDNRFNLTRMTAALCRSTVGCNGWSAPAERVDHA